MADTREIAELATRLGRLVHGLQFCGGLNPAQWEALRFLGSANKYSCSPSALAEFLGTTRGTASQTLISLETKGYIERRRGAADRRSVDIRLTDKGREVLACDPLAAVGAAAAALPEDMRDDLQAGLERLLRALVRGQGLPEFGRCGECTHFRPEPCAEGGEGVCRCALTAELLDPLSLDKLCVDFRASTR